jgi:hypothetical protein
MEGLAWVVARAEVLGLLRQPHHEEEEEAGETLVVTHRDAHRQLLSAQVTRELCPRRCHPRCDAAAWLTRLTGLNADRWSWRHARATIPPTSLRCDRG